MNEDTLNSQDESIRRLLAEAVGPQALLNAEIEAMLTTADATTPLIHEQLNRIVIKVGRLIETADDADHTVTSTAPPAVVVSQSTHHVSQPRLAVVSTTEVPLRGNRKAAIASLLASLLALVSVAVLTSNTPIPRAVSQHNQRNKASGTLLTDLQRRQALYRTALYQMTAKPKPETPPAAKVVVGDEVSTGELERRRVVLPDGSVLYANSNAHVKIVSERRVEVTQGEVFVEVVPIFEPQGAGQRVAVDTADFKKEKPLPPTNAVPLRFEVVTPTRTITALGTKFAVTVGDTETDVVVTQGKVRVSGVKEVVAAGRQLRSAGETILTAAPSPSTQLEWTRDLMAAATGPLMARSEYSGGALVTMDPTGQSSKLSLRNYHIDVHIEDGFARTTIDQTYFNHTNSRLEGTFHFPLPTDASLSRLAMYVNGKLMEGGMAERNHARNTFEEIKRKMLDPALLEWVDGSTFKMRVFPLEPRQEKRIVLSYSQLLPSSDGLLSYRFPAGHTMDTVRDWSAHVVVTGAAGNEWKSQSHAMRATETDDDLVLDAALKNALLDKDLVVTIAEETNLKSQISNFKSDGQQYLMLRLRPDLAGDMQRKPHHWVILFEHAGDRTPLLARAQIEIIRTLLNNAEHSDTFSIVTASSRAALYADEPQLCGAENVAAAMKSLENVHLVSALDLAAGLKASGRASALRVDELESREKRSLHGGLTPSRSPVLVHVGSCMPGLGERDAAKLAELIPNDVEYIGIGVGRRWNESMMKQAASLTGGLCTQINPDEDIAWRAFDVFNKVHSPRLVNVECRTAFSGRPDENELKSQFSNLKSEIAEPQFLHFSDTITQGEEIAAICRIPEGQPLPNEITVTATLNGQPWSQTVAVRDVKENASYLPRHWAKLEIDRLLAEDAAADREAIIALSKSMYVMSPFTSLLVLENDEMYTQFNVDRGRKDHWALYACPETIEVVVENEGVSAVPAESAAKSDVKTPADVMSTVVRLPGATYVPMHTITLTKMDPTSAVQTLRQLYSSEGTSAPVFQADVATNRIVMSGSADQVLQSRQVIIQLEGNHQVDGNHQRRIRYVPLQSTKYMYGLFAMNGRARSPASVQYPYYTFRGPADFFGDGQGEEFWWWSTDQDRHVYSSNAAMLFEQQSAIGDFLPPQFVHRKPLDTGSGIPFNWNNQWFEPPPDDEFLHGDPSAANSAVIRQNSNPNWRFGNMAMPSTITFTDTTAAMSNIGISPTEIVGNFGWEDWDASGNRVVENRYFDLSHAQVQEPFTFGVYNNFSSSNFVGTDPASESTQVSVVIPSFREPRYDLRSDQLLIENSRETSRPHGWECMDQIGNGERELWTGSDPAIDLRNTEGFGNVQAIQDLGIVILKGNEADVKAVEMIIADLESHQRMLFDDVVTQMRPELRVARPSADRLSYFSNNVPASSWDDLIQFHVQQDQFGRRSLRKAHADYSGTQQTTVATHRWAADAIGSDTTLVRLPNFHHVNENSFAVNPTMFGDLISHAPGLNTSEADVMAVVEAEANISNLKFEILNPPAGRVDEAARGLIEKARSHGWESLTLPGRDGEAGVTVMYDGLGRHVWERVVSEGLREHVVCDGERLWNVYREIGLASKRPFSRFHHRNFSNIVPWLLPSVEDLSRGADVVAVDERTVAIVPVSGSALAGGEDKNSKSQISNLKSEVQLPAASAVPLIHLIFADDGRLAERRIVEREGGKVLRRVTYDADGTVKVLDGDGKELLTAKFNRSIATEPQLVPDLNGLVVLPMPVRKPEVIVARTSDKDGKIPVDADLSEDDAISLMLAFMANGNGARVVEIARSRFIEKNDIRDGLYVLLSRFPMALVQAATSRDPASTNGESPGFDLRPPVEGSPLKQFVRQYINWLRDSAAWQPGSGGIAEFRIDAPQSSFLQRMATARNLYVRWLTDAATKDLTQAQVQQEVDQTLHFIGTCRTIDMGWALMNTMRPRLKTPEHLAAFAKAAERFEQHPQVGLLVRRERMTALLAAEKHDEAMTLFEEWLSVQLQHGMVPPIGKALYDLLAGSDSLSGARVGDTVNGGQQEARVGDTGNNGQRMNSFLLAEANRLADSGLLKTLNSLAVQMRELGNTNVADQMITMLLTSLDAKQRPDVSLYAIEHLRQMKDARSDKLLDQVMELPMADQIPQLWRFASKLAEESGRKRLAAERLEHAIRLEFASRPTTINIETVRHDYAEMLAKFDELITAAATLEVTPPDGLSASIVQAADQWRTLDEDDTTACQTASRLLAKLNRTDLAWDYLVTPLAENSGESGPWIELARRLGNEKQIDLADMAWSRAFEFESTNPEILLDHAMLLQSAGRSTQAKAVLQRVAHGTWQPRFSSAVQKIQELLQTL